MPRAGHLRSNPMSAAALIIAGVVAVPYAVAIAVGIGWLPSVVDDWALGGGLGSVWVLLSITASIVAVALGIAGFRQAGEDGTPRGVVAWAALALAGILLLFGALVLYAVISYYACTDCGGG